MNAKSMVEIEPKVLILASRFDVSCDFVVARLRARRIPYFRLNSEDLTDSILELDPLRRQLVVRQGNLRCRVTPATLGSIYFRRPVFLRDYGGDTREPSDRFSRLQWASFLRNLILFDEADWINHPVSTYRAEHKALQLAVASRIGFAVPETVITNAPTAHTLSSTPAEVAIKGVDTVFLRDGDQEMFGFTTIEEAHSLDPSAWKSAPATVQAALTNKLDIRATVVGGHVFAASITVDGQGVSGDWRSKKGSARFAAVSLPIEVERLCLSFMAALGLRFGGIDLAFQGDQYYFLEVNPTGEWAWLVDCAGLAIDQAIANLLSGEPG